MSISQWVNIKKQVAGFNYTSLGTVPSEFTLHHLQFYRPLGRLPWSGEGPSIFFRWSSKSTRGNLRKSSWPNQSQELLPGVHDRAPSRGHEVSPQSGLGVGCKLLSSSKQLHGLGVRAQARRISISLSFSVVGVSSFLRCPSRCPECCVGCVRHHGGTAYGPIRRRGKLFSILETEHTNKIGRCRGASFPWTPDFPNPPQ